MTWASGGGKEAFFSLKVDRGEGEKDGIEFPTFLLSTLMEPSAEEVVEFLSCSSRLSLDR